MRRAAEPRRLAGLGLAALALGACGERVGGPADYVGQLRVQPVFGTGTGPDEVGVAPDRMRVEMRRGGGVQSDTVVSYDPNVVLSWILALESESEPVDVRLSLMQQADTLYRGDERLEVRTGTVGSAPVETLEMLFRAVRDSVTYRFDEIVITEAGPERSLGSFAIPPHVEGLGVDVFVDILLSGDEQRDEAFALAALGGAGAPAFIGDPACPVVADDPSLGRGWVRVGSAELAVKPLEFLARHAAAFPCYTPAAEWGKVNSVHFFGVRLVYFVAGG